MFKFIGLGSTISTFALLFIAFSSAIAVIFTLNEVPRNINLVALEEVTDPRNIGSIIRSAVAFNIDGLIVKERSFPSKSKLLYKSASGGTEHLKIFKVSNLNTALNFLKTKDFWISAFDINSK